MLRSLTAAAFLLCATSAGWTLERFPAEDADDQAGCEEQTVYGTFVVIDEELGIFGLLGTRYRFQSDQGFDFAVLQGRTVRIDIGRDCGIEDIRVLDGRDESITKNEISRTAPAG